MKMTILLFLSLASISSYAVTCGTEGSIKERMEDCSHSGGYYNGTYFSVVTQTEDSEIIIDKVTKRLWSHALLPRSFKAADKACQEYFTNLGLQNVKGKTPSLEEYRTADSHGLSKTVSVFQRHQLFWTSNIDPYLKYTANGEILGQTATVFNGGNGSSVIGIYVSEAYHPRYDADRVSVRCVTGPTSL